MEYWGLRWLLFKIESFFWPGTNDVPKGPEIAKKNTQDTMNSLRALIGRTCIYQESIYIREVSVVRVDSDEWGVHMDLLIRDSVDFDPDEDRMFRAGANWEEIVIWDKAVSSPNIGWNLIYRPDLVERICATVVSDMSDVDKIVYIHTLLAEK